MALNTYGLQCLTTILTGAGVMVLVMVIVIGTASLLSHGIVLPDQDDF